MSGMGTLNLLHQEVLYQSHSLSSCISLIGPGFHQEVYKIPEKCEFLVLAHYTHHQEINYGHGMCWHFLFQHYPRDNLLTSETISILIVLQSTEKYSWYILKLFSYWKGSLVLIWNCCSLLKIMLGINLPFCRFLDCQPIQLQTTT